jgi:hypothetical protein
MKAPCDADSSKYPVAIIKHDITMIPVRTSLNPSLFSTRTLEPPLKGLALVLMIISRLAVTGRWHVLLHSGGIRITPSQSFQITMAGLFANNFLPTTVGGDVIRLAGQAPSMMR